MNVQTILKALLTLMVMSISFCSCNSDDEEIPEDGIVVPYIKFDQADYKISGDAQTLTVTGECNTTNIELEFSVGCNWMKNTGTRSAEIQPVTFLFEIEKNNTGKERKASVLFKVKSGNNILLENIDVTQHPLDTD